VPKAKTKGRLIAIKSERERLRQQLGAVDIDLTTGVEHLEASLALLENPIEPYLTATDEAVSGVRLHEPHDTLRAAEAAYEATKVGLNPKAVDAAFNAAYAAVTKPKKKTASKGGLSDSDDAGWAALFKPALLVASSNSAQLVRPKGFEPPTF
jgi:hypothetical protein